MHPRTQEITDFLDSYRAALEQAVDGLPQSLRARRPAPERWSVAEVLEHLAIVEARVLHVVEGHIEAARALGRDQETSPVGGMLDVSRLLDRSHPLIASEASQPRGAMSADAAWAALVEVRGRLLEAVRTADGLAMAEVKVPHTRFGELNLYQWLLFVGAHEGRHTGQVREIGAALAPDSAAEPPTRVPEAKP